MRKPKILTYYAKWTHEWEPVGLCNSQLNRLYPEIFSLVKPDDREKMRLIKIGQPYSFWGRERYSEFGFTPLRQNLVLLCACLNGEL